MTTFVAIDIGSYELSMKVFEISKRTGIRQIDHIRHRIELGKDAYALGKIGSEMIRELCQVLYDFTKIMKGYKADHYRVCATSGLREASNLLVILNQIKLKTGLEVDILGNSEERFLRYKSIAFQGDFFQKVIQKGTAIVDLGGGSLQISLFDKEHLVTTQNMRLGAMRVREALTDLENQILEMDNLIEEFIHYEITTFKNLYLQNREIKNIIAFGSYMTDIVKKLGGNPVEGSISRESLLEFYKKLKAKNFVELTNYFESSSMDTSLLLPAFIIFVRLLEETDAENIWTPGVNLSDGMAYDFAEKNKFIGVSHDFDNDILGAAKHISKRYMANKAHSGMLEKIAISIYEGMKKSHGLGKREKLLLQIAVILHDCGKYISLSYAVESSYNIIMSTEIIGLSHLEREIIASIVKYNVLPLPNYEELTDKLDKESYLVVAKLSAITRIAHAMDKSHKQKMKDIKVSINGEELLLVVDTTEDITLEAGWVKNKANFFEEVFGLKPVLRKKRKY